MNNSIQSLTDEQLLSHLKSAASLEREATARLIALLVEMDARKLYLGEGYASLFVYCTRCLHLSEHAAYGRIEAARAARRFPMVLELLSDGSMTLTTVCLLASHLNEENHRELLDAARHRSKREIEQQVAALGPKPDVLSAVRRLPQPKAPVVQTAGALVDLDLIDSGDHEADSTPLRLVPHVRQPLAVVTPLAPERYKVQLTIGRETHDKLRRVQDLLRHVVPSGDPAAIFDRALTLLLNDLERRRLSKVERPRRPQETNRRGRYVPADVKRQVWARDDGRCAFVGTDGRCAETGFLELHHVVPFADGGQTTVDNLQLRCRAHNAYEARQHFGPMLIREHRLRYELGPDRVGQVA
jgi:5-methylcytosine-specific restriction endonuclease McrA